MIEGTTDKNVTRDDSQAEETSKVPIRNPSWEFPCLVSILLLAFLIRIYGINFGLPNLYYWDEPTVVNRAVRFGSGDLNPHFFSYPALYMYVLFVLTGGVFLLGRATGHYHSAQDFAVEYVLDPSRVYLAARLLTACIGTACVLLTYVVGKRYFDRRVGLVGALLFAFAGMHAGHSHVAITDVPQSFLILAACLPLHKVLMRGKRKDYLITGLLIGLGAATKYLAVLLIPSLLLACWFYVRGGGKDSTATTPGESPDQPSDRTWRVATLRNLPTAFAGILVGFCVGSPYNIINFRAFLADFRDQSSLSQLGTGTSFLYYLQVVLPHDVGTLITLGSLVGILCLLWRRRSSDLLFLLFPIFYFLFVGRYPKPFPRYMIPEDPFVGLLAGYAAVQVLDSIARRLKMVGLRRLWKAAWAFAMLLVALPGFWKMLQWDALMAKTHDPRNTVQHWVEQNIPSGSTVCIQSIYGKTFYNVPLMTDRRLAKIEADIPNRGRMAQVRNQVVSTLRKNPIYHEVVWNENNPTLEELDRQGVQYVVMSNLNDPEDARGAQNHDVSQLPAPLKAMYGAMEQRSQDRHYPITQFAPAPGSDDICEYMPITYPHLTVYRLR